MPLSESKSRSNQKWCNKNKDIAPRVSREEMQEICGFTAFVGEFPNNFMRRSVAETIGRMPTK